MLAFVALSIVSLLAPCQAEDTVAQPTATEQPQPSATETLEVDIAAVTKLPRSLEMMTRVWYLLFQASQEAKVNPAAIAVVGAHCDTHCIPDELRDQLQRKLKKQLEGEFIVLYVSPQAFPGFVDAVVKYGARRPLVNHTSARAWAVFPYLNSWPGSSALVPDTTMHVPTGGKAPWNFFIIIETSFNDVMPPDVYQAISKYALPVQ